MAGSTWAAQPPPHSVILGQPLSLVQGGLRRAAALPRASLSIQRCLGVSRRSGGGFLVPVGPRAPSSLCLFCFLDAPRTRRDDEKIKVTIRYTNETPARSLDRVRVRGDANGSSSAVIHRGREGNVSWRQAIARRATPAPHNTSDTASAARRADWWAHLKSRALTASTTHTSQPACDATRKGKPKGCRSPNQVHARPANTNAEKTTIAGSKPATT